MKTITRFEIMKCSTEIRIRDCWRDLNKVVPYAADADDPDHDVIACFDNETDARKYLDRQESFARLFRVGGMVYCYFEEYILEENVYSIDDDGNEEWIECIGGDCSRMPESINFGPSNYIWSDARKCWIEIEEEEEEEED